MATRPSTDHVWGYSCELNCVHCGLSPTLDAMSAVALVDVVRGFLLMHRRCEKPLESSKQVELFDALAAKEQALFQKDEHPEGPFGERFESPGISATTDEPDPETDPPGHSRVPGTETDDWDDPMNHGYGAAQDDTPEHDPPPQRHGEGPLLDAIELRHLVTCVRPKEFWPSVATVESWHPDVRADVQRWCRNEHVRASPIAGLPVPHASPMPNVLANVEIDKRAKRGARPLSNPPKKRRSAQQSP